MSSVFTQKNKNFFHKQNHLTNKFHCAIITEIKYQEGLMIEIKDYSNESDLNKEEIERLLEENKQQYEDLKMALMRYYWKTYVGKNVIFSDKDQKRYCVICRGNKLYIYSLHLHPCPKQSDFHEVLEDFDYYFNLVDGVQDYKVVSDEEATEFIRLLYLKKAEASKNLLKEILSYEG